MTPRPALAAEPDAAAPPAPPPLAAVPATPPAPSLWDRVLAWRDRTVASPTFQRWAAAFPLTRPVALRRSRRLFDLCAGFVYSQTLLACLRLRLFDTLAAGPRTADQLREATGLDDDALRRLLGAAEALELVEGRAGGRWGLGPLGAPMVGNHAVAAMLEHNVLLYDDLRDPVALLRGGGETRLAAYWPYSRAAHPADAPPEAVAGYSALMSASQPLVAADVLDAYDVRRHRVLLDVGGGEGTFVRAAAARAPHLRLHLFDLPAVAERARARFAQAGLATATAHGGDFLADPLPAGADVATLVRVLHDHGDDDALALLRAVHRALAPGGTVVVGEPMAGVRGAETVGAAYFAFYLLAMGSGRARTPEEYGALLRAAGFRGVRRAVPRTPVQTSVLTARK